MTKQDVIEEVQNKASLMSRAARALPEAGGLKKVGTAFSSGSSADRLTVISGGLTGLTFSLMGFRAIINGLKKDEEGKRKWGDVAVGASQAAGGLVMGALFVERLSMKPNDAGSIGVIGDNAGDHGGGRSATHFQDMVASRNDSGHEIS